MGNGDLTLHVAPYSMAAYSLQREMAWFVLVDKDIEGLGSVSGSVMVHVWGTNDDQGFILSSNGALAEMTPLLEVEEDDLMTKAVILLVAVSVPGAVIGLIYMNSKSMQKWWMDMSKKRRKRKEMKINSKK